MGHPAWKRVLPILLIPAGCCIMLYLQNKGETKLQSTVCFGKDSKFIYGRWTEELVDAIKRRKESEHLGEHGTLLGRQVIS